MGDETLWYETLAERGLWPGLPGALLHCSALRSLRCPASCVSALRAMPGLATLELDLVPKDEGAEDGMPRPEEPWPAATSLPALRSLTFNHCKMVRLLALHCYVNNLAAYEFFIMEAETKHSLS